MKDIMNKTLNTLRNEAHQISKDHGFYDDLGERNFGEAIALMHSELSEALEDYRDGRKPNELFFTRQDGKKTSSHKEFDQTLNKPCGIPSELADVIIRVLDFCGANDIDIEGVVEMKMEYNKTRPYKNGKVC